jgi:phytoene dehydrogenase-like protein
MSERANTIVVVGGGLAGLSAAALAARAGAPVTLVEKSSAIGGRAASQEKAGFVQNLGPHALYRGGAGMRVLRGLGIEPRGGIPGASGGHAVADGRLHALPGGPVSLLTTSLLGLGAKLEVGRLLARLPRVDAAAIDAVTIHDWLARTIQHEPVRRLVEALFRLSTYVNDPRGTSAGLAVKQLQLALAHNVLYLDGGWQTLVTALRERVEQAGVHVRAGARAVRVEHDGAVRAVVLADGTRLEAAATILAVDPPAVRELLDEVRDPALAAALQSARPVEAACLDVCLSRLPQPRSTFALGIDRPHYLSVHSAAANLAPEGQAMIHVAKYLPPEGRADGADVERELEALLDLVQPGWRGVVVQRRFLPHLVVTNAGAPASGGGLRARPAVAVRDVAGAYLAGDWVGSEGWLADASLASGAQAASEAAAHASRRAAAA